MLPSNQNSAGAVQSHGDGALQGPAPAVVEASLRCDELTVAQAALDEKFDTTAKQQTEVHRERVVQTMDVWTQSVENMDKQSNQHIAAMASIQIEEQREANKLVMEQARFELEKAGQDEKGNGLFGFVKDIISIF